MDLYLLVDFYQLRDDLPDWRDVPAQPREETPHVAAETPRDACAYPHWKVF